MGMVINPFGISGTSGVGDSDFSSVVLLLGFNGANAAFSSNDESSFARGSGNFLSSAQLQTANKKFGSASLALTSGDAVTYADSNDFSFGSGDFTIELFFSDAGNVSGAALLTKYNGASDHEFGLFAENDGAIEFFWSTNGSTDSSISASPGYSLGTWYHVAFSRVGNTGYLCFNGTIIATGSMSGVTISNEPSLLAIGGNNNGTTANFFGAIDEVRITKGVGRYSGSVSSSYTVPTAAFPRS